MQPQPIKLGPYAVEEALVSIQSLVRRVAGLTSRAKKGLR